MYKIIYFNHILKLLNDYFSQIDYVAIRRGLKRFAALDRDNIWWPTWWLFILLWDRRRGANWEDDPSESLYSAPTLCYSLSFVPHIHVLTSVLEWPVALWEGVGGAKRRASSLHSTWCIMGKDMPAWCW